MDFLDTRDPETKNGAGSDKHWVFARPKWYKRLRPKWLVAWQHYECDFDVLRTKDFLIQRVQGESDAQFQERLETSDYLPLFGTAVDSLVGRLTSAEPIKRQFYREGQRLTLGDPDQDGTHAYTLYRDIDGRGTNYLTMLEDLAIRLTIFNEMWVYVEGPRTLEDGTEVEGRVVLIEPISVVNVVYDQRGNPIDVLVRGKEDQRTAIDQEEADAEVYWRFMLDGTQKIVVTKDEDGNQEIDEQPIQPYEGGFNYYRTKRRAHKTLPVFRVTLPLRRMVGYILAQKNNVIFNQESERDNILRIACTPMFVYVGTDDQFRQARESRIAGDNALQLDPNAGRAHYYAAPPTEPADLRTKVLRDKVADFFVSAFRFYEDSIRGKQKTATEIGQDAASGEGSFLNTLAQAMDEAEYNIFLRMEQSYFPDTPDAWGQFAVSRPRKFEAISPREEADKLADLMFGEYPVPIGETGRLNAMKQIAEGRRFQFDEEEAKAEMREWFTGRAAEKASGSDVTQDPPPAPPADPPEDNTDDE